MANANVSLTLNPLWSLLMVGWKRSFHGSFPPIFQASYRPLISPGTPIARPQQQHLTFGELDTQMLIELTLYISFCKAL